MNKKHRKGYKRIVKENQEERKYSNALLKMIETHEPNDEDWMGFKLTKNNPYTFHHIREKRKGGKESPENGAILTLLGHQFLNYLDSHNHLAYEDYQDIFRRINKSHGPIDDDLLEDIYGMMLDMFYYNSYHIPKDVLSYYDQYTEAKVKVKKL